MKSHVLLLATFLGTATLGACTATTSNTDNSSSSSSGGSSGTTDPAAGTEIGKGDGSASSVTFVEIGKFPDKMKPVDLAFHTERPTEAWVVGYGDNSVQVGVNADTDAPTWKRYVDPAARHFMHKPPAVAAGVGDTWGTCGDNDNGQNMPPGEPTNLFMGPALFSANLQVFATRATDLGSHLDMLHNTPFCRGIAHQEANVYWVFNSFDKSIDKYNFNADHGPGNDDHSDGEIYRYAEGQVKGSDDGTPSHVFFDKTDNFLYIADTGNQRIARLDTTTGTKKGVLARVVEPLKGQGNMMGTTVEEVVPAGTLQKPAGLEVKGDLIYVTDAATSTFHVFDKKGKEVRKLATDLPAGSLAGFVFGPGGKIYFKDKVGGRLVRIDP